MMLKTREWQLQEAKSRLSEVLREAGKAPQTITLHGKPAAVVVSFDDYRRLTEPKRTLMDVMRSAPEGFSEILAARDKDATLRETGL
jgi:prevent-host-death family protein